MSYEQEDMDDREVGEEEEEDEEEEELPQQVQELANASVPNDVKHIRACKRCGLLKTREQFYDEGCENCPFLYIAENMSQVERCTTPFWEGQACIMDPRESWTAKWIRVNMYLPGVYALQVTGQFDRDLEEEM
jgi:transcription elongation factor SPT4